MKIKNATLKKLFIVLPFTLTLVPTIEAVESQAGFFVEPSITYERGDTTVNYPSPFSESTGSANGFGIGARVGIHFYDAFFFGVDGRYSMPWFNDSLVGYDESSASTNWGPVVGMQTPVTGLRVWGSYILGGIFNPDQSGNFDVAFKDLSGYRIGTGFKINIVSLNLEYQHLNFGEADLEQLGPFSMNTSYNGVELENNSWIVSVSFPLAL